MKSWKIGATIVVVFVIIGATWFYTSQYKTPIQIETPTTSPIPTPTATPEETRLPTESEAESIEETMNKYVEAYNKNSPKEIAEVFTEDGMLDYAFARAKGTDQIETNLVSFFDEFPNATLSDTEITEITIIGDDKAIVVFKCTWTSQSVGHALRNRYCNTQVELEKIGDEWKIIEYNERCN